MEEPTYKQSDPNGEIQPQLTSEAIKHLLTAAKWGKFLAILGFICIAFILLAGLLMGLIFSFMADKFSSMGGIATIIPPKWFSFLYILLGIVGVIPVYFLNSFSNNITRSVRNNNTGTMTVALKRLKSFFVFVGIYTIAIIALYIIIIIVVASAALLAA
jgi:hypothetical protein